MTPRPNALVATLSALTIALSTMGALACTPETTGGEPPQTQQGDRAETYDATGVVRRIELERGTVTIHHDPVPGYMPEMTMPFHLEDTSMMDGIAVDDAVRFTFRPADGGRHVITAIQKR